MNDFQSTIHYLYGLQSRGMKFGLKNIQRLLTFLGDPHEEFPSVHIAGTNGKGSTASMIAAILTAAGYKTGLYTSPHLVRFTERIRINGKEVSERQVAQYARNMRGMIEKTKATFFEATTAIAFQFFCDEKVDVAVVETGLGGRLDATNVLHPVLTIITSIGFDHTEMLGRHLENIAHEKAGIIKKNVPCLVGDVPSSVRTIFKTVAGRHTAQLRFVSDKTHINVRRYSIGGTTFDIHSPNFDYKNLSCSLAGKFQESNITLTLEAIAFLKDLGFKQLQEQYVRAGLSQVQKYTGLRGRLEIVSTQPLVIADVAHNPDAMRNLMDSLRTLKIHRFVTVFGVMRDKDIAGIVTELKRLSRICIAVAPRTTRAAEPADIARVFHGLRSRCIVGNTVPEGVSLARHEAYSQEPILVTGSHYVVGELLEKYKQGT